MTVETLKIEGIHKKLFEFQKMHITLTKNMTNPFYKSRYTSLNKIQSEIFPILNSMNVFVFQVTDTNEEKPDVLVTTLLDFDDRSYIESRMTLIMQRKDEQAYGSSLTYKRRYALVTMLCLEQYDDDGNNTIYDVSKHKKEALKKELINIAKTGSHDKLDKLFDQMTKEEKDIIGIKNMGATKKFLDGLCEKAIKKIV